MTVIESFVLTEPSLAAAAPSELGAMERSLLEAASERSLFDTIHIDAPGSAVGADVVFKVSRQVMVRPAPTLMSSLIYEHDDGQVIASDPLAAAYGCGASADEAAAEWEERAREHYEDLLMQEHHLHPRMTEQLRFLRRLFG